MKSPDIETTLEIVSSYIFYQNFLFTHIWHTLKSNLSNFSKYAIFPADLLFFYCFRFVSRVYIQTPMSRISLKTFGTILMLASEQHSIPWKAYLKNQSKNKIFFFLKILKNCYSKVLVEPPCFFKFPLQKFNEFCNENCVNPVTQIMMTSKQKMSQSTHTKRIWKINLSHIMYLLTFVQYYNHVIMCFFWLLAYRRLDLRFQLRVLECAWSFFSFFFWKSWKIAIQKYWWNPYVFSNSRCQNSTNLATRIVQNL